MRRAGVRLPRRGVGKATGVVDCSCRCNDQAFAVGFTADDAGVLERKRVRGVFVALIYVS